MQKHNFLPLLVWIVGIIVVVFSIIFICTTIYDYFRIENYYRDLKNTYTHVMGTITQIDKNMGPSDGKYRCHVVFDTQWSKNYSYGFAIDEIEHTVGEQIDVWYSLKTDSYGSRYDIYVDISRENNVAIKKLYFIPIMFILSILSLIFMHKFNILKLKNSY